MVQCILNVMLRTKNWTIQEHAFHPQHPQHPSQYESISLNSPVPIQQETEVKKEKLDVDAFNQTIAGSHTIKEEETFAFSSYCSLANDQADKNKWNLQNTNLRENEGCKDEYSSMHTEFNVKTEEMDDAGCSFTSINYNIQPKINPTI